MCRRCFCVISPGACHLCSTLEEFSPGGFVSDSLKLPKKWCSECERLSYRSLSSTGDADFAAFNSGSQCGSPAGSVKRFCVNSLRGFFSQELFKCVMTPNTIRSQLAGFVKLDIGRVRRRTSEGPFDHVGGAHLLPMSLGHEEKVQ